MLKIILNLFIVVVFSLISMPLAAAEKKGSLEISPAFSEVVLDKPDQERKLEITFLNHSDKPLELEMFPIDFKQSGDMGEISFLNQTSGSYSYSLSSFLSLESNQLELKGGEKRVFKVTIRNREDISPGGHYAAVIGKVIDSEKNPSSAEIAPSLASLIFLRKTGGERFNLSLVDVDFPKEIIKFDYPKTLNLLFQNEGNIHLVPYGRVEIHDIFGRLLYQGVVNSGSAIVFPETKRYIRGDLLLIHKSFPISLNTFKVQGQDSLKKISYTFQETYLYINPVILLGILAIIAILSFLKKTSKLDKD
jgi:hypothetical protein